MHDAASKAKTIRPDSSTLGNTAELFQFLCWFKSQGATFQFVSLTQQSSDYNRERDVQTDAALELKVVLCEQKTTSLSDIN